MSRNTEEKQQVPVNGNLFDASPIRAFERIEFPARAAAITGLADDPGVGKTIMLCSSLAAANAAGAADRAGGRDAAEG